MKSALFLPALAALSGASLVAAAHASTATSTDLPTSVDASSFLSSAWSGRTNTPTWATGRHATALATALYSLQTSFLQASDYRAVVDAIYSAAEKDGGDGAARSLSRSGWNWGAVTTNAWYADNVPAALQTEVARYDEAWEDAFDSVYAAEVLATATAGSGSANAAAAAPRCTGMAVAGVVAGVAAVAGAW